MSAIPDFARPSRRHVLANAEAAEQAREGMRQYGRDQRIRRQIEALVTDHGNPHIEPYDGPIPAAAKRLLAKAESKGMTAQIVTVKAGCAVEAYDVERGVAFRAWYLRGRASGGSWHERHNRYEYIVDPRPVKTNALTKTALAGYRAAGMSSTRLVMVASRSGLAFNNTEIEKRVNAL